MPRGRKARNWIKIDCEGILRGSINYLLPLDGQAIWVKMIAYSEVCGGRPGFIEDNNNNGLPHDFIAQELHCPIELFEMVLNTMKSDGAIEVNGSGSIQLVNFVRYQFGEYDRQKPYREGQQEAEKVSTDEPRKAYGEFQNVLLTETEYGKLVEKFGQTGTDARIEKLSSGIASKGYHYKNYYATILTWERIDERRNAPYQPSHGKIPKKYTHPDELRIPIEEFGTDR